MGPFLSPDFNGSSGRLVLDLLHGSTMIMMAAGPRKVSKISKLLDLF